MKKPKFQVLAVTKDRWSDFETLFGERGACGGCWCMLWRLTRKEFEKQKGARNRRAMKKIIQSFRFLGTQSVVIKRASER